MNKAAMELAQLRPVPAPYSGWEYDDPESGAHCTMSDEGRNQLVMVAYLHERHFEAIEAWMDVYGLTQCEHGRPLTDLSWEVNDYAFDLRHAPQQAIFILCGFHYDLATDENRCGPYCVPWAYHAAGVVFPW